MERRIGIIMHGVTGRMGMNQHLIRSILAIRAEKGMPLPNGDRLMPDPILVGRNAAKVEHLAKEYGVERWTDNLDEALANPDDTIFFDAGSTQMRAELLKKAIAAGKHVYCEKPIAESLDVALDLARTAEAAGVKNGAVQDKLWLPGLLKLKQAIDNGALGRILDVRIDFGYWVFEGDWTPAQRPSWNYRKEDGGGVILDMMCHWRYVIDNLFGDVSSVVCRGAIHIPERWDENGDRYDATADDAAYAIVELKNGAVVQIACSWCTRVRRDDLVTFHVNGTHGSAVAGLTDCRIQSRETTPKPVWNPDEKQKMNFFDDWQLIPEREPFNNAFKAQWELFLRHVVLDTPFRWTLMEACKGVQFAELALKSWDEKRFIDVPELGK
ncbi:Gfo/Idh/MocA family oxidoreductase [uncultured Sneathiella sp.]|jgi:predicted dehydrogenase|uniref:Gfo/Idh/MocA family protein n=1 Tax=uncultured Sneathiella sp. TaxID=879315 RepID=UPI0030DC1061|tara:strand:- start:2095 stop:3243 length:1149 start_codon:yes stop_codon:yes gene_type:complete